jgi:hypothetical protein
MRKTLLLMLLVLAAPLARAAIELPNKVTVSVAADVTHDAGTGLFTYRYTLTSDPASVQNVSGFYLRVGGSVLNIESPMGWNGRMNVSGDMLHWSASKPEGIVIPPGYVDDGNLLPSIYQIKPGQTLGGFSFQSPDPPQFDVFYARGFRRLLVHGVDFEPGNDPVLPDFPDDLFKGPPTKVPRYSDNLFLGGRRPGVDGFLAFKNIENGALRPAPVLIDLVFGVNGETVRQETFRATLNNVDVTHKFAVTGPNTRRGVFPAGLGGVKAGRNVLLTTVEGIVPGTTRSAADTDRISFTVE